MKNQNWFYRCSAWNRTYYWPCHWVGAILMFSAVVIALAFASLLVDLSQILGHPLLGWLSIIAVFVVYGCFDRIADRHARD